MMPIKIIHLNDGHKFTFVDEAAKKINESLMMEQSSYLDFTDDNGTHFWVPGWAISWIEVSN